MISLTHRGCWFITEAVEYNGSHHYKAKALLLSRQETLDGEISSYQISSFQHSRLKTCGYDESCTNVIII